MELKRKDGENSAPSVICLNRTFYGIETRYGRCMCRGDPRLNRTFYGIETVEQYTRIFLHASS